MSELMIHEKCRSAPPSKMFATLLPSLFYSVLSLSLSYKVILLRQVGCDRCFNMQSSHACLNIIKKQKTFQVTRVSSSMYRAVYLSEFPLEWSEQLRGYLSAQLQRISIPSWIPCLQAQSTALRGLGPRLERRNTALALACLARIDLGLN